MTEVAIFHGEWLLGSLKVLASWSRYTIRIDVERVLEPARYAPKELQPWLLHAVLKLAMPLRSSVSLSSDVAPPGLRRALTLEQLRAVLGGQGFRFCKRRGVRRVLGLAPNGPRCSRTRRL